MPSLFVKRPRMAAALLALLLLSPAACENDPSGPTTGDLVVVLNKTGVGTDADGFGLTLDGAPFGTVGATGGTFTATGVSSGSHTVLITGVAANCTVSGGVGPHTVSVPRGGDARLVFTVTCT